jgi:hypothetical protein
MTDRRTLVRSGLQIGMQELIRGAYAAWSPWQRGSPETLHRGLVSEYPLGYKPPPDLGEAQYGCPARLDVVVADPMTSRSAWVLP